MFRETQSCLRKQIDESRNIFWVNQEIMHVKYELALMIHETLQMKHKSENLKQEIQNQKQEMVIRNMNSSKQTNIFHETRL